MFRTMDNSKHSSSEPWKRLRGLRGLRPILILGTQLAFSMLTQATTLVLPPAALPDMETMESERFKVRWPQIEINDGTYPIENGFWVTYQHDNLTYFVGPYEEQAAADEGQATFNRIRTQLIAANAKFENSKVGVLELNIDRSKLKRGGGPSPGQRPGQLDGKIELPPSASQPGVRSVSTNPPPQDPSTPPPSEPTAHNPPGEFQENGGGQVFATEGEYLDIHPAFPPFLGRPLPNSHDLSLHFPPAGLQGKQNSCTGWSIAYAMKSYHERLEEGWELVSMFGSSQKKHVFSPAYVYNQVNGGVDEGAKLTKALAMATTNGICSYVMMPYKQNDYRTLPSPMAHDQALRYKIDFFSRVDYKNITEVKTYLNAGFPMVVGMFGDSAFEDLGPNEVWKELDEKNAAGHALTAIGYNDRKKAVRVYNSWGTRWGKNGLGWIAYDNWTNVVKEAYILKDAPNEKNYMPPIRDDFSVAVSEIQLPKTAYDEYVFKGTATVPAGYKGVLTVEVQLQDASQRAIPGLQPAFKTTQGQAATLSDAHTLPTSDTTIQWQATMPASNLASATPTNMNAHAVLFIDNFGVVKSEAQRALPEKKTGHSGDAVKPGQRSKP